eukprot:c17624_g1_i4.p2 GENE.c17624_g1_i4~~c17624_g1_i4.p2  ORF type:complete len:147 (+),score=37.85 c17624_g1_i4:509-949(+)
MTSEAVLATLKIGEYIVIFIDEETQAQEKKDGYNLPFSVARILKVNFEDCTVDVVWMFAEFVDTPFVPWKKRAGDAVLEEKRKPISDFQQPDLNGDVIKVKLTKLGTLQAKSLNDLSEWFEGFEEEWKSCFSVSCQGKKRRKTARE